MDIFENMASSQLFFIYGLIALVIILIIAIIIIDKKESKRKPKNLFDTLNMKIIADPTEITETVEKKEESIPEVIEIKKEEVEQTVLPIQETEVVASSEIFDPIKEAVKSVEDISVETDLEKTQAQLRVEEITNALKQAQVEEKIQEDKYAKFEEEQEKNAIISYNELKESFDKLYSENEKTQYLEDDEIPINIEELYQLKEEKEAKTTVTLKEFSMGEKIDSTHSESQSTFKNSPFISPVYGIQEPPLETNTSIDTEIRDANQFLQNLKELKNNLD